MIVESPTKVKTIGKYLGKDYTVMSSKGHIRDLPKSGLGVDVEHDFAPEFVVIPGKEGTVKELQKAAKTANEIILATDLDREGEAISWHIRQILDKRAKSKDKSKGNNIFKRVIFHEITKSAVEEAFKQPRELNDNLVDAYQARRVLDRIVGYKLSPLLWEKIRYGLSAGRVQSVVVRLIVERERERERFESESYFHLNATFQTEKKETLPARLAQLDGKPIDQKTTIPLFVGEYTVSKTVLTDRKKTEALLTQCKKHFFAIGAIDDKEVKRNPRPPFNTASLQRQAATRLGFTSKRTMSAAQKLYEAGHITYHRTDAVFLADQFITAARKHIKSAYGTEYVPQEPVYYASTSKSAQEAHEAIRPTDVTNAPTSPEMKKLATDQKKLYSLIWRQAVSSQMTPARLRQLRLDIHSAPDKKDVASNPVAIWRSSGSTIIFDGWMKVAGVSLEEAVLPVLMVDEAVTLDSIDMSEHQTDPPPRYTEASLIKDLEKYGIGRPSTYAPTISTVEGRRYVSRQEKSFVPEATGIVVNDLLVKHFPHIVDLDFTAEMEDDLDEIAHGRKEWVPIVAAFYDPFIKMLEKKKKEIKKEDIVILEETDEKCPECGKKLVVKLGKYGKFLSCSNFPDCKYAAPLEQGENGEIEQPEDLDLEPCPEDGGELVLKQGRYGKFIACSNYPKCKYTRNFDDKIDMQCPTCTKGDIVIRRTKRGRVFYGCSRYPECEYSSWTDPRTEQSSKSKEQSKGTRKRTKTRKK